MLFMHKHPSDKNQNRLPSKRSFSQLNDETRRFPSVPLWLVCLVNST